MSMSYFRAKAEALESEYSSQLPEWVSEKNASFKAWQYVEDAKIQKARYIKRHNKKNDFSKKKLYLINGAEVAQAIGVSRSTLMNTSTYSESFYKYLENVNKELEMLKRKKIKASQNTSSRGTIRNSKDELLRINESLKSRVKELENQKTEELVRRTFDELPLPVKKKLGID